MFVVSLVFASSTIVTSSVEVTVLHFSFICTYSMLHRPWAEKSFMSLRILNDVKIADVIHYDSLFLFLYLFTWLHFQFDCYCLGN